MSTLITVDDMAAGISGSGAGSAALSSFASALRAARYPVALAGAGLSAASGIPTFRGSGAASLWRQHDAMALATPQAFAADPSKVWQFYHYRRTVAAKASPNDAHKALARVAVDPEARKKAIPAAREGLPLITQNVDGLSVRALRELKPDLSDAELSRQVIEMHGALFRTRCTTCGVVSSNHDDPICAALAGAEDLSREYRRVPLAELPHCTRDTCRAGASGARKGARSSDDGQHGLLRPDIVWFGESFPEGSLERIDALLARADLILVLGTSSTVYRAAGFAARVRANGGKTAVFNLENDDDRADWFFKGPVEVTLPAALGVGDLPGSSL